MRFLSIFIVALLLLSCEEPPNRNDVNWATPLEEGTLLTLDPTEKIEFTRWWTNGTELLRLDKDHRFAIYENQNRYYPPIERGRWDQQSYAVLRLEPYSLLAQDPVRASIARVGGQIEIRIPDLGPFHALPRAPKATEESLFGEWSGTLGSLALKSTMRYIYSPDASATSAFAKAGNRGRWQLEDGVVKLIPDALGMGPYVMALMAGDDPVRLSMAEGEFELVTASAPAD
ncbi:MAG: hypothetical protein O7G85_13460 [Planctomycetota bacterium]|nr:hypothetical protein [Planctomycetota bacterium]